MELTEKMVKEIGPSPFASRDQDGKYLIFRHLKVDLSGTLPGVTQAIADVEVVYERTEEEVQFFRRLIEHLTILEEIYRHNERPFEVFTTEEMEKKVASIVKGRPYNAKVIGLVTSPTEETRKNIMDGKPLSESGLPNFEDIDVKTEILKDIKNEDPK